MNTNILVGGASTQSRGRRPLPMGAVGSISCTEHSSDVFELTEYQYEDGRREYKNMLSWVIGQHGCLWGFGLMPPEVMRELTRWEMQGSYGSSAEWRLVDSLGEVYSPFISSDLGMRFFGDGGTALAAAARIARNATGKKLLASCGYHGAAAEWAHIDAAGNPPGGQLEAAVSSHLRFEFGDVKMMRHHASVAACICVEVPAIDDENLIVSFLAECRKACDDYRIPFILDEVVTGFRLALAGACFRYDAAPDIVCLGKAMSAIGGISAIVGRLDLVEILATDVFLSTTFGGNPMMCSIADKTIRHLQKNREGIYGEDGYLRVVGEMLKTKLNEVFGQYKVHARCVGQAERFIVEFEDGEEARRAWCSRMMDRGILVDRPFFTTLHHTEWHVKRTVEAAIEVAKGY